MDQTEARENSIDLPVFRRLAPSTDLQLVDASADLFSGICSDENVGRDQHVVITDGIQYQDFLNAGGPILFAHDETQPNIGGATRVDTFGDVCRIYWRFVPRDISRFAGMIQDLVAGKWLRTLSMSWRPIDGVRSRDPERPKGFDFLKVDMLECSIVPIPALPSALIDARARGVDTKPLYDWAEKLLDTSGQIIVPRTELESLRRAAKMTTAVKSTSAAAGESESPLKAKHKRALSRAPKVPVFKRGLYDVAQLAYALGTIGYCHDAAEYEAALEEDNSPVPAMLGEALKQLGEALIAMTEEEVKELLGEEEEGDGEVERELSPKDRAFIATAKTAHSRAWRLGIAVARSGKSISASNEKKLEEADAHHERAMKHSQALGEHHEAVGEHMKAVGDQHERATSTLTEIGEHLRSAQENPATAGDEIGAAAKKQRTVATALSEATEEHRKMGESHEDVADSHRALGRSAQRAQRCVRSVLAHVVSTEPDDESADEADDDKAERAAERTRKARETRAARAREIAKQHREPITLD